MGRGGAEELELAARSPGRRPGAGGEREGRVPSRLEPCLFFVAGQQATEEER